MLKYRHAGQRWTITNTENEFRYEGTFENRVRALDTWQNGSLNVKHSATDGGTDIPWENVWNDLFLNGLLPMSTKTAECTVQPFQLESVGGFAVYDYVDVICEAESARLHVILDVATEKYLRIDFTCEPAILSDWMKDNGEGFNTIYKRNTLMEAYGKMIDLGALQDLDDHYTDGEAIQSFEANVQGSLCSISFKYALQQGLISYKLFAQPFQ